MHWLVNERRRDYAGGVLMIALGLGAALQGAAYSIGSLRAMGPGFFPTALGILLALIGLAIASAARFARDGDEPVEAKAPEWRGWICLTLAIVAFAVLGTYGGLVPATFAIAFISALGDRDNRPLDAAMLAAGCVVIAVAVFHWGLALQFPLFQWGGR
ncbi:MAG: tripartite tricarboxylate transporter TctB family protein [Proteobacteria bacterium]|nr:tripartite tricarboxylate transporter TctB family protein [Pseudomonadota bacterium]